MLFLVDQIFACGLSWHQSTLGPALDLILDYLPQMEIQETDRQTLFPSLIILLSCSSLFFQLQPDTVMSLEYLHSVDQYCIHLKLKHYYYSLNRQWSLDVNWFAMVRQCPLLDHKPYCMWILDICHEALMTPNYNLLPQSWWGLCFSASTIRTLYVTLN